MRRNAWGIIGLLAAVSALASPARARVDASPPEPAEAVARRALEVANAVLANHLDPPTRQQMILQGLIAAHRKGESSPPDDLATRVSDVNSAERLVPLLEAARKAGKQPPATIDEAFRDGLLAAIPGGGMLVSEKELGVQRSFESNLYVGIHVALSVEGNRKRPVFNAVFEGGPAALAGIQVGDRLEAVDGVATEGEPLAKTVERLRGPEGSVVEVVVTTGDAQSRALKLTRGRLLHPTVTGVVKRSVGGWDVRLPLEGISKPVGYLRIERLADSTPQELRIFARRFEEEGIHRLVLDLRQAHSASLHATVLVADALLEQGNIGGVRTRKGREVYRAEGDALFADGPIAVLIDTGVPSEVVWLAAALQDTKRAVVVGRPISLLGETRESVPLASGGWAINLYAGRLERGDGRPLGNTREALGFAQGIRRFGELPHEPPAPFQPDHVVAGAGQARTPGSAPVDVNSDPFVTLALKHLNWGPVKPDR